MDPDLDSGIGAFSALENFHELGLDQGLEMPYFKVA